MLADSAIDPLWGFFAQLILWQNDIGQSMHKDKADTSQDTFAEVWLTMYLMVGTVHL